jgi:hypothetical protein
MKKHKDQILILLVILHFVVKMSYQYLTSETSIESFTQRVKIDLAITSDDQHQADLELRPTNDKMYLDIY